MLETVKAAQLGCYLVRMTANQLDLLLADQSVVALVGTSVDKKVGSSA